MRYRNDMDLLSLLLAGACDQLVPELLLDRSGKRWCATAHPPKHLEGKACASDNAIFVEHDATCVPLNPQGLQEVQFATGCADAVAAQHFASDLDRDRCECLSLFALLFTQKKERKT